jgi:hypothetical protein
MGSSNARQTLREDLPWTAGGIAEETTGVQRETDSRAMPGQISERTTISAVYACRRPLAEGAFAHRRRRFQCDRNQIQNDVNPAPAQGPGVGQKRTETHGGDSLLRGA